MDHQKERKNKSKGYDAALCVRTERLVHEQFMSACHNAEIVPAEIVRSMMLRVIQGPEALDWLKGPMSVEGGGAAAMRPTEPGEAKDGLRLTNKPKA